MDGWSTMEQTAPDTWRLSEYRHWEETHCCLLLGRDLPLRGLVGAALTTGGVLAILVRQGSACD